MIAVNDTHYAQHIAHTLQEHACILPDEVAEIVEYITFSS